METIPRPEYGNRYGQAVEDKQTGKVGFIGKEINDGLVGVMWKDGSITDVCSISRLIFHKTTVSKRPKTAMQKLAAIRKKYKLK